MVSASEAPKPATKTVRCAPLAPRPHPHPSITVPVPIAAPSSSPAMKAAGASDTIPPPDAMKKRQFTKSDEETLVRLWKENIEAYYKGVRRRVLEKMTRHMNAALSSPPYFALKQVENKLSYMEKRYRSVLEEMRRLGFSCDENDPSSVRISCERKFCLFYDVHDILRDVVGNEAYSKRTGNWDHTPPAKNNSASGTTTLAASAAPPPRMGDMAGSSVQRVSDGGAVSVTPPPPELDEPADAELEQFPPLPLLEGDENNCEVERDTGQLKRKADVDDAVGNPGTSSAAVTTPHVKRRRANSGVDRPTAATRIAQVAQSFVVMSERMLAIDEEQRRDETEISKRELDIRRQELDLKHKEADVRLAESRNKALTERIAALKFLATSLGAAGDVQGQARAWKKMEELVGPQ